MDFIYVLKKYWTLAKGERVKVSVYLTLHILSVIAITVQPIAFAMVINKLQEHSSDMLHKVIWWLLAYVACFYAFELCHRIARGLEIGVAYRNKKRFVLSTYWNLQSMPLSWHAKHHSGNVVSRMNKAADALYNFGLSMYEYITAIFQYLNQMMQSFWFYGTDYESCLHWKSDLIALEEIFESEERVENEMVREGLQDWNHIMLSGVSHRFEDERFALHDISIGLQRSKRIAFVGESGSGKSTLLKIVRGIYPVAQCRMSVDYDNKIHNLGELAEITTLIPQEPEMFDHTVLYNITMGLDASQEEIDEALYLSGFDEVLAKLPRGLNSMISEDGVNLSGGEKQRLALARGIFSIKDSSIILLDEPTASLDTETEYKIYERLFTQYTDKCMVSVVHRLHLLHLFDYIYVFKDGKIVEEGELDQLIGKEGYFKDLWNRYMIARE